MKKIKAAAVAHKVWTTVIVIVVIIGGYEIYSRTASGSGTPQYVLSQATIGNIVQTVSGTGQVSAENQIDVTSKVSGTITSIAASVGQRVRAGDLIATIDPTDALHSLKSAELSLEQVTSSRPGDLANAQNALDKSYSDGFSSVSSAFTDLQTVMSGLNSMLYSQTGFLGSNSSSLNPSAQVYRNTAGLSFDKANAEYQTVLAEYQGLTRQSDSAKIDTLISDTYDLMKAVSAALQNTQDTVNYIAVNQPNYYPKDLTTAQGNVTSWLNSVNGDVSAVSSASNSITSNTNSLRSVQTGSSALSLQSAQLAVDQARETYDEYFIRAPFDGVIGRIPVTLYSQAGGSTVIATVVGDQKVAAISLNEVDATKVATGQSVSLTFDAIDSLTATGTVQEVDLVGAVTQGVVSYGVKLAIATSDARIRPGMSINASIVTSEKDGVLIVPTAAVKTSGGRSYVQVLATSTVSAYMKSLAPARAASSTGGFASSTRAFAGGGGTGGGTRRVQVSLTVPSATAPTNQTVVTGASDDTNTEIVSGLSPRQWVVTRTIAASSATATAAPSLLSSIGTGGRGAGGVGGAAAGR